MKRYRTMVNLISHFRLLLPARFSEARESSKLQLIKKKTLSGRILIMLHGNKRYYFDRKLTTF